MDASYRQIIKRIIKEERMSEETLTKLLNWYDRWNNKLSELVINQNYAEIIDSHFKVGLGLLSSMKSRMKDPDNKKLLTEKFEILRSKLVIINNARKSFDAMK